MPRTTIVITDERNPDITRTVVMEEDAHGKPIGVVDLRLTAAPGVYIRSDHFQLVAQFVPAVPTHRAYDAGHVAVRAQVDQGDAPADGPRKPRPPSVKPGARKLRALYDQHGGNISAMSREYGCAISTMFRWVNAARDGGGLPQSK